MVERDDNDIVGAAVKIGLQKMHGSPQIKSAATIATLEGVTTRTPVTLGSSTKEREEVVLVVEAPRAKLVMLAARLEQSESKFGNGSTSPPTERACRRAQGRANISWFRHIGF